MHGRFKRQSCQSKCVWTAADTHAWCTYIQVVNQSLCMECCKRSCCVEAENQSVDMVCVECYRLPACIPAVIQSANMECWKRQCCVSSVIQNMYYVECFWCLHCAQLSVKVCINNVASVHAVNNLSVTWNVVSDHIVFKLSIKVYRTYMECMECRKCPCCVQTGNQNM